MNDGAIQDRGGIQLHEGVHARAPKGLRCLVIETNALQE